MNIDTISFLIGVIVGYFVITVIQKVSSKLIFNMMFKDKKLNINDKKSFIDRVNQKMEENINQNK